LQLGSAPYPSLELTALPRFSIAVFEWAVSQQREREDAKERRKKRNEGKERS